MTEGQEGAKRESLAFEHSERLAAQQGAKRGLSTCAFLFENKISS